MPETSAIASSSSSNEFGHALGGGCRGEPGVRDRRDDDDESLTIDAAGAAAVTLSKGRAPRGRRDRSAERAIVRGRMPDAGRADDRHRAGGRLDGPRLRQNVTSPRSCLPTMEKAMNMRTRRRHTAEQKAEALKRHHLEKHEVSTICEDLKLNPSLFYTWQRTLFAKKDAVIAEISAEYVELKKELGAL